MSQDKVNEVDVSDESQEQTPANEGSAESPVDPLAELQAAVAALEDKNLRLAAELRNSQQRAARERSEAIRFAEADFARELLVVLDDLERTMESAKTATDATAVAEGVRIIHEHFLKVLRGRGIEPIDAAGKPFDPEVHEALLQQPSDEVEKNTVLQEVARGYRMHERVLRPAKVCVSSGTPGGNESA